MKMLLSALGQVGLVEVGWTEESVEEEIKSEVLELVLMALASLSASNEMATEAREIDVYTMLALCDRERQISPTSESVGAGGSRYTLPLRLKKGIEEDGFEQFEQHSE
jgi:hypothetical protein